MNTSEKTDEIAPALVAAQRKLKNPKPDTPGQVRGKSDYKYVSLGALLDDVRDVFKELGLFLAQDISGDSDGVAVTTRIGHLSGQFIEFGPLYMPTGPGPQDRMSATTYARRYQLSAAAGLAPDKDDDGKAAQQASRSAGSSRTASPAHEGAGALVPPPASAPSPSSGDDTTIRGGASPEAAQGADPAGEDGTAPEAAATPEQFDRLLRLYGGRVKVIRVSGVKKLSELTAAKAEELILAKAGA
ncbi:MAG TPA: ERF family protein [Actinomycetota bacterium]|nr:ERF family protein [Actinomycetota bacterium]